MVAHVISQWLSRNERAIVRRAVPKPSAAHAMNQGFPVIQPAHNKQALWDGFCDAHGIAAASVPLFAADTNGVVDVVHFRPGGVPFLRRSVAMEDMIGTSVKSILAVPPSTYEGMLYLMLRLDSHGRVIPLYVGRAGRHGKNGTLVSANLKGIPQVRSGAGWTNGRKFARWGYGYAYHIGDLSCVVLSGHEPRRPAPKYVRWAHRLFESAPTTTPQLRFDVRFWCTPWGPASPGIWPEFGSCPLAFIEYLLIGVASLLFPDNLLNEEGVSRRSAEPDQSFEQGTS
jgi:hypothetical protein